MEKEKEENGERRRQERGRKVGIQVRKGSTEVTTKVINDGVKGVGENWMGWNKGGKKK